MNKIFSFDIETNGLWGEGFCIGAVVYENGIETKKFLSRCPLNDTVDDFVTENVLPELKDIPVDSKNYEDMLKKFSVFYKTEKENADVIVHMGVPVEAKVLIDMHRFGFIGDWEGPYPLIDIAGNLLQAGYDPTSVDSYNKEKGISVPLEGGGTHNPLYDSRATALCYMDLMK